MIALNAKRVAARILKVGESKIWIDPDKIPEITSAITKDDVRRLISEGVIKKSKGGFKSKAVRVGVKKRRKTKAGKKRGTAKARIKPKKQWMRVVRAQRKKLRELKAAKIEFKVPYRKAYKMVKGGFFKGKKQLEAYVGGVKK